MLKSAVISRLWLNVLLTVSSLLQGRTVKIVAAKENESRMEIFLRIQCRKQCQGVLSGERWSVRCNASRLPVDGDPLAYFT